MENLTEEQHSKLAALLDRLGNFPVPEMIVRCEEALVVDPAIEADRVRMDAAMAGAWAYDRMLLYLDRLRSLNKERMQLGTEILRLKQHPSPKTEAEVEEAAWARVMAPHLAGKQEIVLNFFAVSVQHIHSLLKVVAEAVGYEIPQADLAFLDKFRLLRNHFEHWYDRLPGRGNDVGLVTKTIAPGEYRVRGGLETDGQDRVIVVVPKKPNAVKHLVEANADGVTRVEKIVQETDAKVRELALERVRAHYTTNPTDIPSPDTVREDLLISVGGREF